MRGEGYRAALPATRGEGHRAALPAMRGEGYRAALPAMRGEGYRAALPAMRGEGHRAALPATRGEGHRAALPAMRGEAYRAALPAMRGEGYRAALPAMRGEGHRAALPAMRGEGYRTAFPAMRGEGEASSSSALAPSLARREHGCIPSPRIAGRKVPEGRMRGALGIDTPDARESQFTGDMPRSREGVETALRPLGLERLGHPPAVRCFRQAVRRPRSQFRPHPHRRAAKHRLAPAPAGFRPRPAASG
jgi:hypothetical protein